MIDVDPDAYNGQMPCFFLGAHFYQNARDFAAMNLNVIGQLNRRLEWKLATDRTGYGFRRPSSKPRRFIELDPGAKQNREPKPLAGRRFPAIPSLTASGGLMFG